MWSHSSGGSRVSATARLSRPIIYLVPGDKPLKRSPGDGRPRFWRGVINLRGAVVPVIDLGMRFCHGATAITKRTCTVIVEVEHDGEPQVVGILVDAVNEVMDIASSDIESAPSFGAKISTEFIAGMARIKERFVIILEPDRVLSVDEMAAVIDGLEAPSATAPANQ